MSDLIPHNTDLAATEAKGRQIYKSNQHFRNVAEVMEHPEFRKFYEMYMEDWDSTRTILMFMKLYEAVEKRSNMALTPYQKIAIVEKIMTTSDLRKEVVKGIREWSKSDVKFLEGSSLDKTPHIENARSTSPICLEEHPSEICTSLHHDDAEH